MSSGEVAALEGYDWVGVEKGLCEYEALIQTFYSLHLGVFSIACLAPSALGTRGGGISRARVERGNRECG